jgi:hydrogenase maturation protein HypF
MTHGIIAKQIDVKGIVQGVGFRPHVFQLAQRHALTGQVSNTASGVQLVVEGRTEAIDAFVDELQDQPPPLAQIVDLTVTSVDVEDRAGFVIASSSPAKIKTTLISPDVATCEDCLRELRDPADRRHGYPFINCTNCGPRYTIIDDIPYDRPNTTMSDFTMCPACQAEYDNPYDRRFHAQPNACRQCGPQVTFCDRKGNPLIEEDPIAATARLLRQGNIVAIKGLGGFHLAVDAFQDTAVARLRKRKVREEKPLAVMSANLEAVSTYAHIEAADAKLLTGIQRPIVLLPKRLPEKLAFSVAPRNRYYGVMLPYTPLHHLLLDHDLTALVMTSGNLSEEPIAIDNDEAFQRLGAIADYFLIHDRRINLRSDDSIMNVTAETPRMIRRSRGYVPKPVFLSRAMPSVLACGAELKNTVCLTRDDQAFVSQHIGDLENTASEAFFEQTIDQLQRILDIQPEAVACDAHPDYLSTNWATRHTRQPILEVFHHHAHIAACLAEHKVEGTVIGLAFDGTGLGDDGTIWGGEVLMADQAGYRRAAHIETVPMPGGAAAIKAPWRMALAYLQHVYGTSAGEMELPFLTNLDASQLQIVLQMAAKGINSPRTSSLGRLFDGVAALMGLRREVAFEGQAAMELEMIADDQPHPPYAYQWREGQVKQISLAPIIRSVVDDIRLGVPAFVISRRFHQTLIALFGDLCMTIADETGLKRVALSGGCFQNRLLLEGLIETLEEQGLTVFSHQQVPTNDGGIALGQAVVAGAKLSGIQSEVQTHG